jgi:hypothetical protein
MSAPDFPAPGKRWTAAELRKLPKDQRDAILEAAAALAEEEYRINPELTATADSSPIPHEENPL